MQKIYEFTIIIFKKTADASHKQRVLISNSVEKIYTLFRFSLVDKVINFIAKNIWKFLINFGNETWAY